MEEPAWNGKSSPVLVVDPDQGVIDLVQCHIGEHEAIQVRNHEQLAQAVQLHLPRAIVYNYSRTSAARDEASRRCTRRAGD
jgi:hypothetical protein